MSSKPERKHYVIILLVIFVPMLFCSLTVPPLIIQAFWNNVVVTHSTLAPIGYGEAFLSMLVLWVIGAALARSRN